MDICHPPVDWSCKFSEAELERLLDDESEAAWIKKAEAFAWSTLAALTAYRIGTCPITVRPCAAGCLPPGNYPTAIAGSGSTGALQPVAIGRLQPYISGGRWYNACGCSPSDCSCSPLSRVILPGPVGAIEEVRLGGEALSRDSYRILNGNQLIRLDGEAWPTCQDMMLPDEDGFTVTYYRGAAPNILTRAAAGALAAEFYEGCKGGACRLPTNLVSMSRGGESYDFEPTDLPRGDLGIPEVNAVIAIYNPNRLKRAPTVSSPDAQYARVPTWN